MMTNQRQLSELSYDDCYFVMDWLMRQSEKDRNAVCDWLAAGVVVGMWIKTGETDESGDPIWKCSCGSNEHAYGNHHPENRRAMCTNCGTFNFYMEA